MTYKTLKTISNVVLVLFIISCGCTVLGFKKHSDLEKENSTVENTTLEENLVLKYFLEDSEIEEIPQNEKKINEKTGEEEINILYKYGGIKCSEGVNASFDEEDWNVTILENGSGTCELSFYKANYDVSFIVLNGTEDKENPKTVERYKDGVFKIIPNNGYEYVESQCSNDKIATYDSTKQLFNLSSVNSDIACKITFGQKKLKVELTVKNGVPADGTNGVSKMEVRYGESVTQIVTPQTGFEFTKGHLTCTNNQEAEFKSNNFSIQKVTNDTKCKLEFTKTKVVKYKIKITNSEDYVDKFTISKGSDEIEVEKGSTGEIKIKSLIEGEAPKLKCDVLPKDSNPAPLNSEYTFSWLDVTKNISCKIIN